MTFRSLAVCAMGLTAGFMLLAPSVPAHAALGHAYASVETDRAALGATITSTSAGAYTLHDAQGHSLTVFTREGYFTPAK